MLDQLMREVPCAISTIAAKVAIRLLHDNGVKAQGS